MDRAKIGNMEEFAAVSGISRPTLSKYFNEPGSVRPSTRQRIEAALERYDYRPNIYAMNQNRRQTKVIGIIVPYLADPFFAEIARVIERACREAGFRPVLFSSHGQREVESENLTILRNLRPAGVLLGPLGRASDQSLIEKCCEDIPTVLFDGQLDDVGSAFVGSNHEQIVELSVEYLLRSGEPPSFFEMQHPPNPNAVTRSHAYANAMERRGHRPMIVQAGGEDWNFEDIGYREGLRALAGKKFPTNTVLCSNDRLAIGLLAAAYKSEIRTGRGADGSLRVAGHDDHPFSRFTCPSLTTVSQDYAAIAASSVSTLLALLDSGASDAHRGETRFEGRLVMRDSA